MSVCVCEYVCGVSESVFVYECVVRARGEDHKTQHYLQRTGLLS